MTSNFWWIFGCVHLFLKKSTKLEAVAAQMNGVGKTHHIHRQIHKLQADPGLVLVQGAKNKGFYDEYEYGWNF